MAIKYRGLILSNIITDLLSTELNMHDLETLEYYYSGPKSVIIRRLDYFGGLPSERFAIAIAKRFSSTPEHLSLLEATEID